MSRSQAAQAALRPWTFMVYLAGDNNLEDCGIDDLAEMKAAGSSPDVAVVAQFDRMSDRTTRRYYLTADNPLEADCRAELPAVNTGDPAALVDFARWAIESYPAERYALVLWNHGAGWKDDDIYRMAEAKGVVRAWTRSQVRRLADGKPSRALFRPALEKIVVEIAESQRAVLFDDSSADFLDSVEMQRALAEIVQIAGHPLDLLGFDACLMSMLEVVYQVRDQCRVVVGSQEVEPGCGWPYDRVLTALAEKPDMNAEALGARVVAAYADYFRDNGEGTGVTQAAVRTSTIGGVCEATSALADGLLALLDSDTLWGRLAKVQRDVQRFTDREYVDLRHMAGLLAAVDRRGKPGKAARAIVEALDPATTPVVAEAHLGPAVAHAGGLSIYLPSPRALSSLYANLDFANDCRWSAFLNAYVGSN